MKLADAIYLGLTNIGQSLEKSKTQQLQYEQESKELGLIPDKEKIKLLKQDLYRKLRSGGETEEIRKAIHLLRSEVSRDAEEQYYVVKGYTSAIFNVLIIIAIGILTKIAIQDCPGNSSQYCQTVNRIGDFILKEEDSDLLPSNIE